MVVVLVVMVVVVVVVVELDVLVVHESHKTGQSFRSELRKIGMRH